MNKSNFYLHRIYHKWQLNCHQHLLIYADKYFEIKIKHRIHLNISYLCLENHPIIKKSGPFQLVYIRINYKGFLYEHGEPLLRLVNQVCIMIPAVYCRSAYTLSHFNSINNTPSPPIRTLHPTAPWPHSYLIMSMYFFANFKNLEYGFLLFFDVLIAYQFVVFSL